MRLRALPPFPYLSLTPSHLHHFTCFVLFMSPSSSFSSSSSSSRPSFSIERKNIHCIHFLLRTASNRSLESATLRNELLDGGGGARGGRSEETLKSLPSRILLERLFCYMSTTSQPINPSLPFRQTLKINKGMQQIRLTKKNLSNLLTDIK